MLHLFGFPYFVVKEKRIKIKSKITNMRTWKPFQVTLLALQLLGKAEREQREKITTITLLLANCFFSYTEKGNILLWETFPSSLTPASSSTCVYLHHSTHHSECNYVSWSDFSITWTMASWKDNRSLSSLIMQSTE